MAFFSKTAPFTLLSVQSSRSRIFNLNGPNFGVLPEEIQMRVLRCLSINDLLSCRSLNSHFKDLCDDEDLWRELTASHFDFGIKKIDCIAWRFWYQELHKAVWRFNPSISNKEVQFSKNLFHAWVPSEPNSPNHISKFTVTICTESGFNDNSSHYFEVTIDQLDPSKSLVGIGMARRAAKVDQPLWDAFGGAYYSIQTIGIASRLFSYGEPFSQGDVIGVLANLQDRTIEFFKNQRSLGVAYTHLPQDILYPAIVLTPGVRVTINPIAERPPKQDKIQESEDDYDSLSDM